MTAVEDAITAGNTNHQVDCGEMKTKQQGGTIVVTDNKKNKERQGILGKIITEFSSWNLGCESCNSCPSLNLQRMKHEAKKDQAAKTCKKKSDNAKGT
jgi:hypothetical protein